jgi:hypothetical protein
MDREHSDPSDKNPLRGRSPACENLSALVRR